MSSNLAEKTKKMRIIFVRCSRVRGWSAGKERGDNTTILSYNCSISLIFEGHIVSPFNLIYFLN